MSLAREVACQVSQTDQSLDSMLSVLNQDYAIFGQVGHLIHQGRNREALRYYKQWILCNPGSFQKLANGRYAFRCHFLSAPDQK